MTKNPCKKTPKPQNPKTPWCNRFQMRCINAIVSTCASMHMCHLFYVVYSCHHLSSVKLEEFLELCNRVIWSCHTVANRTLIHVDLIVVSTLKVTRKGYLSSFESQHPSDSERKARKSSKTLASKQPHTLREPGCYSQELKQ